VALRRVARRGLEGMADDIMLAQQEAPRDVEIAVIDHAAVLADEAVAIGPIPARDLVPGHGRALMMDGVQVVVEKEQAEDRAFSTMAVRSGTPSAALCSAKERRSISAVAG